MRPLRPLLICSIGNPTTRYADTLHSAGHTVLDGIYERLGGLGRFGRGSWQPLMGGQVSRGVNKEASRITLTGWKKREARPDNERDWTLWKSGSLMNISGRSVQKMWLSWRGEEERRKIMGRLIVVHDELEKDLGQIRVTDGSASARGHNGIKSLQSFLGSKVPFTRIAVGIGRPESRDPAVVADYVLRKMTSQEKRKIEDAADPVMRLLMELEDAP